MRRKLFFLTAVFVCAASCAKDVGEARYTQADCRRVAIIDAETGATVTGAEDLAPDFANKRLYVSAYDRRAAERAARKSGPEPAEGGLYAISFNDLFQSPGTPVAASSVIDRDDVENGLRPHGIAFDPATGDLAFINRGYVKDGGRWRMRPQKINIDSNGTVAAAETHCAANDIAHVDSGIFVTADHEGCGWRAAVEDVFGGRGGGVIGEDGARIADKVGFANGLLVADDELIVAATREKKLRRYARAAPTFVEETPLQLPGAPDNLTLSKDGEIVAALHPSLIRLAFQRKLGFGRAGSRIVRIDPAAGDSTILFDDPKGALFSAATAAVETDRGLIAGSVVDEGLIVCEAAS